jgi:tRNA A37 threonylcarbamoyladenosine biosynthesis protein TsaE
LLANKTGALEFDDLDLDTNREESIIVIEWGSDLVARLAESYFLVEIELVEDQDARKVVISKT